MTVGCTTWGMGASEGEHCQKNTLEDPHGHDERPQSGNCPYQHPSIPSLSMVRAPYNHKWNQEEPILTKTVQAGRANSIWRSHSSLFYEYSELLDLPGKLGFGASTFPKGFSREFFIHYI